MRGFVRLARWQHGRLLWVREQENLIVSAALPLIAHLVGGGPSSNAIAAFGIGSGTTAPAIADTVLVAPAYYKALSAPTYPQAGQVQFTWTITGAGDPGAVGLNGQELGIFANTGAATLPSTSSSGLTMYAHLLMAVGPILSTGTYTGTWTFVA